ncbi:MAG: hypothetical protein A2915_02675 [Candidatus Yanofskybacteria bacterium RIFCSPLOWO2_01_FULL_41_34]|uniref:Uncharacterized protein n=1 Tax=Candidatus Yanofskybacteria bacterium RIFCSPHIGHO2_01_FULL_41_26 TaxID=1802661 RepID=A0A1F8EG19_9BACT|nr:MAG: hypothetical protein A2649_03915 [Candidatus Yanofskybacteria bacterium RIFCSPHIGHO2_01_FULL_41_26]OGN20941.1 MAG: hypothetical protein A2915_02675 [Candidatus Yanofskybacteria bacterium RIFCSPLOWO2_01_FULL_41_34]
MVMESKNKIWKMIFKPEQPNLEKDLELDDEKLQNIVLEKKELQSEIEKKLSLSNNANEIFSSINTYKFISHEDAVEFFDRLLDHPAIYNCLDGSSAYLILDFLREKGNPEAVETIIRYVNHILLPGYKRQAHLQFDLYHAAFTLLAILGKEACEKVLQSLAEQDVTFKGWFEKNKISLLGLKFPSQITSSYKSDIPHNDWPPNYLDKTSTPSNEELSVSRPSEFQKTNDTLDFQSRLWEQGKPFNFYRRFRPVVPNSVIVDGANYLMALRGTVENMGDNNNLDPSLNLLSGRIEEKLLTATVEKPEQSNQKEIFEIVSLGAGEVLCLAVLENNREEALLRLGIIKQFIDQSKSKISEIFKMFLLDELALIEYYIKNDSNFSFPELPQNAESFLMYHAWHTKTREIPDFRVLLAEKVRWLMANDLTSNLSLIAFGPNNLPIGGPSFARIIEIVGRYKKGLELYKVVDEKDMPIYWEAIDKLEDTDPSRIVVFGRDGRFFFTALKASGFGIGDKEVKYVVITRNMKDLESRDTITDYLKQNGISLDFTFVDTGFRGSIPELAIDFLSQDQGISLSSQEIDRKITLLSSSERTRTELSRKRRSRDEQMRTVGVIEDHRPQNMESPAQLEMDERGKLRPKGTFNSSADQLGYWIVEHVSLRNFAPKLNPDKRIEYNKKDPLSGLRFVQDYRGESIGTHPMELWEDKNEDKERFLIKGGPEHTLRADFVGQRFLRQADLVVPDTELVTINGQLKLKMEFLADYKLMGLHLPVEFQNSEKIQSALLVDALLGQYDRTPWNLMFNSRWGEHRVAFIDNGASLFSRARGGAQRFSEIL